MVHYFPEYNAYFTWPMLGSYCAFYLALVGTLVLTRSMRDKWTMRSFLLAYNGLQIALCGWMTVEFVRAAFTWQNPMALNRPYSAAIEWVFLVHFATKILDFIDTAVMALKKNWHQISFLHVYHHLSITLVWGYLHHTGDANGTAYFGAALNSFIHFLMYSHYFVTSLGIRNPLKWLLTNLQLVQFVLCIGHGIFVALYERVLPANLAYLQLAYHCSLLFLFGRFKMEQIRQMRAEKAAAKSGVKRTKKE